jgi:hypothetical protein
MLPTGKSSLRPPPPTHCLESRVLRSATRGAVGTPYGANDYSAEAFASRYHAHGSSDRSISDECSAEDGWMASVETAETNADRFAQVLGLAALDLWSELPRELQQTLFERAVLLGHQTERDESLREQLAQFLHHHHQRTTGR